MAGASPQQLTREFVAVRQLRPDIERAVWHCSLNLPPGERPTDQQWNEITQDFMEGMGFSDYTPYVAVRHRDKEHDHTHIVASRIGGDSKVWKGDWEAYKAIEVTQRLEEKYDLTRVAFKPAERKKPTYKEQHKAERTGVRPPRERLQELIDEALAEPSGSYIADKPTAPQLAQRLEDKGVIVRANVASTGKMNGFSFELDGLAFKGSSLGKAYSWSGLQKRGVSYEPDTDAAGLERYKLPVEERLPRTDDRILSETSWSTQTVETSPELEADTDSTSEEPGAEKMLRALEGYYQSQVDDNEEAIETSPQQDFVANYPTGTAPTTRDTDTDSIEAARLEAAIFAVSEIFNQSVEQGKSRARAEEFSSESSLLIEDTAQQNSTEAAPEATQPAVEPSALSKALPTEASPEITQTPAEPSALSKAPPQEPNQQQQWVENLCYDLADLLNSEQTHEVKGKHRTVAWDSEQKRLTLRENQTQEVVIDAEWDEAEERWKDNRSSLTAADFEQLRQALELQNRERERKRQQQRSLGGFELD